MKGIIFDLDGTLLDSMGMWEQLDRRFLLEHGITPPADISDIVKNMTVGDASAYYAERFPLGMTPAQVQQRVQELAEEAYRDELPLKPGAMEFLRALTQREIPFALASVTYPELLDAALTRLRIRHLFLAVLTPAFGSAGKHEPALYLEAAARLDAAPQEIAVIEDALYAAKTAKQAGFYTVGFRDAIGKADWQELEQLCDRTVSTWDELHQSDFLSMF